ncbi:cupredoxin domain-containing protein [Roseivirga echinicomitans]
MKTSNIIYTCIVALLAVSISSAQYLSTRNEHKNTLEQPQQKPKKHIVEIKQLKFIPDYIEVNKGDTIIFINNDYVDHDVTEEKTKKWTSSLMKKGSSWSLVVKEDADYYCTLHVIMKGKIRIKK